LQNYKKGDIDYFDVMYYLIHNTIECNIPYYKLFINGGELTHLFFDLMDLTYNNKSIFYEIISHQYNSTPIQYKQILISAMCAVHFNKPYIYNLNDVLYIYFINSQITHIQVDEDAICDIEIVDNTMNFSYKKSSHNLDYVKIQKYYMCSLPL